MGWSLAYDRLSVDKVMNLLVELDYYWKNGSPLSHADMVHHYHVMGNWALLCNCELN